MTKLIGFSTSAEDLMVLLQERDERYSCTFLQNHPELIDRIWEAFDRSNIENRDEESSPVSREVVETALLLLDSLPVTAPIPEIYSEQDGNIALIWEWNPSWTLFLSVGPNSKCYWAAIFGTDESRGAFTFYGRPASSLLVALARFDP